VTRRDLIDLGIPPGEILGLASFLVRNARERGLESDEIRARLQGLVERPDAHLEDVCFGSLAKALRASENPGGGALGP
jgi:hypothetical protein